MSNLIFNLFRCNNSFNKIGYDLIICLDNLIKAIVFGQRISEIGHQENLGYESSGIRTIQ